MAKKITETPLIKKWHELKQKHPDAILLFRVGDFYEIFGEDAVVASDILGITLTRRANGDKDYIHLAGFPHHAIDCYLHKMVRAGKRVAVCDELGLNELVVPNPKQDTLRVDPWRKDEEEKVELNLHNVARELAYSLELDSCEVYYHKRDIIEKVLTGADFERVMFLCQEIYQTKKANKK